MADGVAFATGFTLHHELRGDAPHANAYSFEPDLPLSGGSAFAQGCPFTKAELNARRNVVEEVRMLAVAVEDAGYRRAAALLLEVAHSIKEALIVE